MIYKIRQFLWRILGFDYKTILRKNDYTLLKNDKYVKIGNKSYDNGAVVWRWTDAPIEIGKYCSIANNVKFIVDEGFHKVSSITNFPLIINLFKNEENNANKLKTKQILSNINQKAGISIGNDVWIGMSVHILPGVKIGNGVTIAANSVISKNIPDYCIVGGVPAKIIKIKHNSSTIKDLNEIAWWEWDDNTIKNRIQDFHKGVDYFVKKYKK